MIQAIDRLRLIHREKGKTVYILCSTPLDLPVDELVTWKQPTGDYPSDTLAECDERGWDALPLAAQELTRLFPKLWATRWNEVRRCFFAAIIVWPLDRLRSFPKKAVMPLRFNPSPILWATWKAAD